MKLYEWTHAKVEPVPILISVPHSGTYVPDDIRAQMDPRLAEQLPDTDWFVDQLYDFAPAMGIAIIRSSICRYVVDLNRDPKGASLYADGRRETNVVPTRSFAGESLYAPDMLPDEAEVARRIDRYFKPYHQSIRDYLLALRRRYTQVILYDAHSIVRRVDAISSSDFPDLILGDLNQSTANLSLIDKVWSVLQGSGYQASHNEPFKGGYITRSFAAEGVHCLQVERSQDIYMDVANKCLDSDKVRMLQDRALIPLMKTMCDFLGPNETKRR
jgi:N-formylglutamate deformylase